MSKKFAEYSSFNLSDINKKVLQDWEDKDVFHQSLKAREGHPSFIFYEGPPSANGMPGIHHVMARSIKDIFCRYKTMKGYLVNRKAGWDTHGLPVELGVEKRLGITKEDIGKTISVEAYNAACRKDVMQFTKEWEDLTHKMGYWVDMNDPYITYDNRYIETLWYLLKELYNKKLIYKGYTIQPYSPAAGTGLSTHELNQPGCYRDVKDTTATVQFKVIKNEKSMHLFNKLNNTNDLYFLAWTTTPWTLPSNTALCVGKDIEYVMFSSKNPYTGKDINVILANELCDKYFKPEEGLVSTITKGERLVGIEYEQLIPWMSPYQHGTDAKSPKGDLGGSAFRVITGDFVTTEDGTGIVHIAPTFGADDDRVAKANGILPMLLLDKDGNQRPMVDLTGKFFKIEDLDTDYVANNVDVEKYSEYAGRFVKNAYDDTLTDADASLDVDLCVMLKQQGLAFKIEKHVHNYPHCWRTDKPVLYYPLDSWFIRTTVCREEMMALNETINWKPQSTGTGRFGKWLENLQDWNLSRSRYWGTPLPIWRTEDGTEEKCIGSMVELMAEIEKSIAAGCMTENPYKNFKPGEFTAENYSVENIDLHRPFVDNIVLVSDSGKPMKRESDLIDVWFDSGAMPYAQLHYPFENKDLIESGSNFPADFISEGVDQTRGWFFTLHAISTMVKGSVAFKNVVSTGLVLDKNGNKMSKRLGNAVDPFSTIEKYGSDPLRWYMMTNASPWDNLKFDVEGIEEVRRKFFGTLYNTYSFFSLYANVDAFTYAEQDVANNERPEIDRWILSLMNTLVKEVDEYYNTYEPTRAGRAISDFVNDHLSNWYVRLNRKRFWGGGLSEDKKSAYQTLYTCLETVARLMAPIAPFYSDQLYNDLVAVTGKGNDVSVHLADFPKYQAEMVDKTLEERMQLAQEISSMVLSLRKKVNIKVRQPLQTIRIPVTSAQRQKIAFVSDIIINETNIKEINFLSPSEIFVTRKVKPNFKALGPKCGKLMKQVAEELQALSQQQIAIFEEDKKYTLEILGQTIEIELSDVEFISEDIPGWLVTNDGSLTVALDITITDVLHKEGIARELVNRIQNIRKSNGYEITDRIEIKIEPLVEINDAIAEFSAYIAAQTLANSVTLIENITDATALDFEDFTVKISIEKA